jgi:hypothetical protein
MTPLPRLKLRGTNSILSSGNTSPSLLFITPSTAHSYGHLDGDGANGGTAVLAKGCIFSASRNNQPLWHITTVFPTYPPSHLQFAIFIFHRQLQYFPLDLANWFRICLHQLFFWALSTHTSSSGGHSLLKTETETVCLIYFSETQKLSYACT